MGRAFEVRKASIMKTGAAKAKLYSSYAKEIYLAAKKGTPEIESNVMLRRIVEKAKKEQVPSDIINRAIDKAKGNSNDNYEELIYEGFGPGASTLMIKTLTNNVNRTISLVRNAFNKVNKSLGVKNSVSYNYDYLAIVSVKSNQEEEILEAVLENAIDVIDIESDEGLITIVVHPNDHIHLRTVLETIIPNVDFEMDEVGMFAKDKVKLLDEDLETFNKLYRLLEDIEDVVIIYHNVELEG